MIGGLAPTITTFVVLLLGQTGAGSEGPLHRTARAWADGKIVEISEFSVGTRYKILGTTCRFSGLFKAKRPRVRPKVAVGDTVRFAVLKDRMYLVDQNGQEYELRAVAEEYLAPPPAAESRP
jgi:hypothetical protein